MVEKIGLLKGSKLEYNPASLPALFDINTINRLSEIKHEVGIAECLQDYGQEHILTDLRFVLNALEIVLKKVGHV